MSRWFRMYEEVLDDPKVQLLPPVQFRMWVNMLALTSRNDGSLPSVKDCSFAFRVTEDAVSQALAEFEDIGLMQRKGETFRPHNWDKRQYKSDTSTDRVKRFRKRSSNAKETPSEAETEAETDKESLPSVEVAPVKRKSQPRASKSLRYFEEEEPLDPDFYAVSTEYPQFDAHDEWEKFRDWHLAERKGTGSIKGSARTWFKNAVVFSQRRLKLVK